jgi:hypothetical protein
VVETVGLENRCAGNRTGGSNPSPSATSLNCRELRLFLTPKYAKHALFAINFLTNRTGEIACLRSRGLNVTPFPRRQNGSPVSGECNAITTDDVAKTGSTLAGTV